MRFTGKDLTASRTLMWAGNQKGTRDMHRRAVQRMLALAAASLAAVTALVLAGAAPASADKPMKCPNPITQDNQTICQ
jgi:hypothetical protein